MLELHLEFETASGDSETLVVYQPNPDLTPKKIIERMREICDWHGFQKNCQPLFTGIIGAKYVERKEEPVFRLLGKDLDL